jgi:tripartite-type tricarboxylate transporter receptor subunit TctC
VNRDGGGGSIGFGALAAARPDGHTLVFSPATPITNVPHVMKSLPYTFDSFVPVCQVFENVFSIAVVPASPYKTLQELLDAARAQPDRLRYGHAGLGSIPHLSMAALANAAGVKLTQVPYRGDAQLLPQLLGGELEFGVPAISSIGGRGLRVLAVFSDKRHPGEPNAPAVTELGYAYIPPGLNGLYAPRGTPRRMLDTLEAACEQATKSEGFRTQAAKLTQPVVFMKGEDFARRLAADYEMKGKLIREIGLTQE